MLLFVFFATVMGYNFIKYFGLPKLPHTVLAIPMAKGSLKVIQMGSLVAFLPMCYFALKLKTTTLLYILGFGVVTFFYAIPFLPKKLFLNSEQNLRNIGGLKVYVIALVWTGVTVFLPIIDSKASMNTDVIITAIQRFVFIIILMLPFEIRDLQYDSLKLATIPQKIGVKQTKLMGILLLVVFFLIEFFKQKTHSNQLLIVFLISLITLFFLLFSRKHQGKYYSSFWVEALPILWLLLIILFN